MEHETVRCNICKTTNWEKILYQIRSGVLVHCIHCDLYYANPRRRDILDIIEKGITDTELLKGKQYNLKGRLLEYQYYLDVIHKYKSRGSLLDIGCYDGLFLHEASKRGWSCTGIEPHLGGASYAKDILNINVITSTLDKTDLIEKKLNFDVITLLAVLEHTPDPMKLIQYIKLLLKRNGLLVLTVPVVPFYLKLIKSRWRHFIGDHYYFFTDRSMNRLLEVAGFKLIDQGFIKKSVDLDIITARLSDDWLPFNVSRFGTFMRKCVLKLNLKNIRFIINLFDTKIYIAKHAE